MESQTNAPQSAHAITTERVDALRNVLVQMESRMTGFQRRTPQDRMIARVTETLQADAGRILAIEAPTGVGKTYGYLIPAVLEAQANGKKLLIATATVALQQQVITDLASLTDAMESPIQAEVVKGRGRYVCDRNAHRLSGTDPDQSALDFGNMESAMESQGDWPFAPTKKERDTVVEIARRRQDQSWSGDMDSWEGQLTPRVRSALGTTHGGCAGASCPYARNCPVLEARAKTWKADVLVTNHALLLADGVNGGGLLPALADCILVVDEAHRLADAAVSASMLTVSLADPGKRLKALSQVIQASARLLTSPIPPATLGKLHDATTDLVAGMKRVAGILTPFLSSSSGKPVRVFGRPETRRLLDADVDGARAAFGEVAHAAGMAHGAVETCRRKLAETSGQAAAARLGELGGYLDWLDTLSRLATRMHREPEDCAPPFATWLERTGSGDVQIHSSGVEASSLLRALVWESSHAAILTSATLTDFGSFDHFARTCGLSGVEGVRYARLRSPFDPGRVVLSVPSMRASPTDTHAFAAEVIEELAARIDPSEGTLVLFASNALLSSVYDGLPPALQAITLRQGDVPVDALLRTHRSRIDAGAGSILCGLATLAEGVDLPGAYNTHTIVVKLPFPTPDDPVLATHAEWLQSRGGNPFLSLYLPDTYRRLVQSCGRLIRRQTDEGRLTLLDNRLLTKPYGRRMLEHLPAYRRADEPVPALRASA